VNLKLSQSKKGAEAGPLPFFLAGFEVRNPDPDKPELKIEGWFREAPMH
jgi:hypothetical protein